MRFRKGETVFPCESNPYEFKERNPDPSQYHPEFISGSVAAFLQILKRVRSDARAGAE